MNTPATPDWEKEFDEIAEEIIGWNYGTIHKQYDIDETCEVLEEDTRKYLQKLKDLFTQSRLQYQKELEEKIRNKKFEFWNIGIRNPNEVVEIVSQVKEQVIALLKD